MAILYAEKKRNINKKRAFLYRTLAYINFLLYLYTVF